MIFYTTNLLIFWRRLIHFPILNQLNAKVLIFLRINIFSYTLISNYKKYIEIDWLQNVDTIQWNELFSYISNSNDVSNNCD